MGTLLVPCHDGDRRCAVAMGNGNARVSRYRNGRTHTRHNLKRDASCSQSQSLLTTSPKDERVAPFQTHHQASLVRIRDEQGIDLLLFHGVTSRFLANKHSPGLRRRFLKEKRTNQAIVDHDISRTKAAQALERNQFRITWPCP